MVDPVQVNSANVLKTLSVCTNFPTKNRPTHGLFVGRRLAKLSSRVALRMLVPQPYFPFLKPRPPDQAMPGTPFPVSIARMFYLPGYAKDWDGFWLERVVSSWISDMNDLDPRDTIIDAHFGYPEGVGCYRVARKMNLPLFITIRGLETELMAVSSIKKQMLQAFDYCTGIVSVSQSLKDMLICNGVDGSKIRVISNGVDSDQFCPGDRLKSRRSLGVDPDALLMVSLGNIQRRKGYDLLIEAIAPYRSNPRFRCVIMGGVNETVTMSALESRIRQLGMASRVSFLGQAEPEVVVQWLRAANMFVLPTRREGCCNAVLEALSTGVPVITTPAGDNAKFISEGVNGYIVPHESPESIFVAMEKSWGHSWDCSRISGSVHQYTWDGAADQVAGFFNERLGRV